VNGGLQQAQHYWLPLAIAGGLALLTAWLGQLAQTHPGGDAAPVGHDPDYFVERFNATAFDINGAPRYRLSAEKMVHYMDDDSTSLDEPRFSRETPGLPRVRAQARRGLVSADGENVYFLGDARLEKAGDDGRPPLVLTTEYLRVIPEANLIRTEKPVTLRQGRSVLTAAGMVADGDKRTLDLVGRVKGVYDSRH
jgi:lipopolysaccharide export system protein LptC